MFEKLPFISDNVVGYKVEGKVNEADYESVGPELDQMVAEHGNLRMLVDLQDFEGIEPGAVLADLKLDMKHRNNVEKLAVVGDRKWEEWMTMLSRPFTTGEVRYFDGPQVEEAKEWVSR